MSIYFHVHVRLCACRRIYVLKGEEQRKYWFFISKTTIHAPLKRKSNSVMMLSNDLLIWNVYVWIAFCLCFFPPHSIPPSGTYTKWHYNIYINTHTCGITLSYSVYHARIYMVLASTLFFCTPATFHSFGCNLNQYFLNHVCSCAVQGLPASALLSSSLFLLLSLLSKSLCTIVDIIGKLFIALHI